MTIADFKNADGVWARSVGIKKIQRVTVSGALWKAMAARCKVGGVAQKKRPTYIGCVNAFDSYQAFAEWCQTQIGYGTLGYALDKDILAPGNKVYGPATCAFVPNALNNFLCSNAAAKGAYPQGVNQCRNKFQARVNTDKKRTHIGMYDTPEAAYEAYKLAKKDRATDWADDLEFSGNYQVDPRVISALRAWRLPNA